MPRRSMAWTVVSPGRASSVASRSSWAAFESVPGSRTTGVDPEPVTRQPISSPPGRARIPAGPSSTSARTASRRSLPPDVRGNASSRTIAAGTLNPASDARHAQEDRVVAGIGGIGPDDDRGHRHLAEHLVASRHDGGIGDGRLREQDGLDLGRRDVLAASHDPVRAPVDDVQPPLVVEPPEVAGPDRADGRGLAHVAAEPCGRRDDDLADAVARPGSSMDSVTPGSARPALPGASRASAVGSAVTPEPASLRP